MKRVIFALAAITFGIIGTFAGIRISMKEEVKPVQANNDTGTKVLIEKSPIPEATATPGMTINTEKEAKKEAAAETPKGQGTAVNNVAVKKNAGPVVFLGDSLTEGLSAYGFFPDAVIAGINSLNTLSAQEHVYEIASVHPSKLFILLGINDIWEGDSVEGFVERYRALVTQFEEQTPGTRIYIESMLPVSTAALERNPHINNAIIDGVNAELKKMAQELRADYIDVNTVMKDENGNLRSEYSNDGVHLIDYYYPVWTEQLDKYVKS